ncbi:MAG: CDP-alcohol phosphatidyltransferase family protein [Deltaproteobacteria bacterium]|nr:CDP-alcohol phosphatidyltransferase family protein [Deltaproteobacteria bacterium]
MSELVSILAGRLSQQQRIWTALGPGLLILAYLLVALGVFTWVCLRRGLPRDAEVEKRGSTVLLGFALRHYFFWAMQPLWRFVLWTGVPATALTTLATLLGLASGVAAAAGRFALGGWLFLLAGVLDALDGRLARARDEASPRGAAIDSILDRYTDAAFVMGLVWYYRASWVLLPALLALVGGFLVPYVRARGEGLGIALRGGALQRPERVVILGVSVALSPVLAAVIAPLDPHPLHELAVAGLVFVGLGSNLTAVGRLRALLRALAGGREPSPARGQMKPALLGLGMSLATAVDLLFVLHLVESHRLGPGLATGLGMILGSLLFFALVAGARLAGVAIPAGRVRHDLLAASVGAALNAGGVALLTLLVPDYRLAWLLTRIAVVLLWGHPMYLDGAPAAIVDPTKLKQQA